jgi:hypothetical protein
MPLVSGRRRASAGAALLCLAISVPAALAQAPPPKPAPRKPARPPLPLDPLTAAEREAAERVARAEARVTELLGPGRYKLISVEFLALKPEDPRLATETDGPIQIGRHAEVLFYRYDGDVGVRVVVDVAQETVRDVSRVDGQAVPLSEEEVVEAGELALHDETVIGRLGPDRRQYKIEGMRILATRESDPCYRHRCVDLLFRRGPHYLVAFPVTVDLTSRDVMVQRGKQ